MTMIHYKQKAHLIQNVIFIFAFFAFLLVMCFPWITSTQSSRSSVFSLVDTHISVYAESLCTIFKTFLYDYESISTFFVNLYNSSEIFECSPEYFPRIIHYSKSIRKNLEPPPNMFIFSQVNKSLCGLTFDKKEQNNFVFTYIYWENDRVVLTDSNQTADFDHFDPITTPYHIEELEINDTKFDLLKYLSSNIWTYNFSLRADSAMSISTLLEDGHLIAYSGVTYDLEILINTFGVIKNIENSYFIILNKNNQVIYDSKIGPIYELPIINNYSDMMWKAAFGATSAVSINTSVQFTYKEDEYLTIRMILPHVSTPHYVLVLMDIENITSDSNFLTSAIFVTTVIIFAAIFMLGYFLYTQSTQKMKNKLRKKVYISPDTDLKICGNIGDSLSRIHTLQLMFPEDLIFNKVLDISATNLTENHHYSSDGKHICQFCQRILPKKVTEAEESEDESVCAYTEWRKMMKSVLKIQDDLKIELKFTISGNPLISLIRTLFRIMISQDLLIKEFDPDILVKFLLNFSQTNVFYAPKVEYQLVSLHHLTSHAFPNWIPSKLDLFSLYFAAILLNTTIPKDHKFSVLNDRLSRKETQIDIAFKNIKEYFPHINNKSQNRRVLHFITVMRELMRIERPGDLDLLGKFRIRIESPEFSPATDENDMVLFLRALLAFTCMCEYWTDSFKIDAIFYEADKTIFTRTELADAEMIAAYHCEVASNVVKGWLRVFQCFAHLNDISARVDEIINYYGLHHNNADE